MERGDNPDELYYLCSVQESEYIVCESDYLGELRYVHDQASVIFPLSEGRSLRWLVKNGQEGMVDPYNSAGVETHRDKLILKVESSSMRYVIFEVS